MRTGGNPDTVQDKFIKMLRTKGLRATPQRLAVNRAMMSLCHASADMVCEYLKSEGLKATLSSVYNILTQFAALKIYGVRMTPGNKMIFDYRSDVHLHMYDTKTGELRDIDDQGITDTLTDYFRRRRPKGYKLDYVDVQVVCHSTSRKGR